MTIKIKPEKMDGGMIIAVSVEKDGHIDQFIIPPAPFEGFGEIKRILETYYELKTLWEEAKGALEHTQERFDLVSFKYLAAKKDFDFLITPQTEPNPESTSEQMEKPTTVPTAPAHSNPVRRTPPENALNQPAQNFVLPTRIITPPQTNATDTAISESINAQERAEQAGKELQDATICTELPVTETPSKLSVLMKERPALLLSTVSDQLPPKARAVMDGMTERIERATELTDLSKPLVRNVDIRSSPEWCTEIVGKISSKLEAKEFDMEILEQEVLNCGVPKDQAEKVSEMIVAIWEKDNRFEKKDGGFFKFIKSLPEKVGLKKSSKKKGT